MCLINKFTNLEFSCSRFVICVFKFSFSFSRRKALYSKGDCGLEFLNIFHSMNIKSLCSIKLKKINPKLDKIVVTIEGKYIEIILDPY